MFWRHIPNWNPVQWSETLLVDLNGLHDLHDIYSSGYNEAAKTGTVEREYSNTTKNHQKLKTYRKRKAP